METFIYYVLVEEEWEDKMSDETNCALRKYYLCQTIRLSLFQFFMKWRAYRLNVHTADFSKYNLGPAFLILALILLPFNFNVNKDGTCLQNHVDSVSLMVLNYFVSL